MNDRKERLWTRDFVIVMIACAGASFCNNFFAATLPIYAKNLTGTTVYAGLIVTVYTFSALVARPIAGVLTDKWGRVALLIIGAALCVAACLLYTVSVTITLLVVVRIVHGIGFGMHSTAGGTVAADIIPKGRMSEGLGVFGLYGTIAQAVGPGVALAVIGGGEMENFRRLFLLAAAICAVCLVLDSQIRYERKNRAAGITLAAQPQAAEPPGPLPKTFLGFEIGVLAPSAVLVCIYIALSSTTSFLTLFARERQFGNIGLFFTVSALGMFISRMALGRLADRRGTDIVVIPALSVLVVCLGVIPFMPNPALLIALAFPLGLSQGAISPALNGLMFTRCSPSRKGASAAAYFSSIDLGYGCGALLFGVIADRLGFGWVYRLAALFAGLAVVVYLLRLGGHRGGRLPARAPVGGAVQ